MKSKSVRIEVRAEFSKIQHEFTKKYNKKCKIRSPEILEEFINSRPSSLIHQ